MGLKGRSYVHLAREINIKLTQPGDDSYGQHGRNRFLAFFLVRGVDAIAAGKGRSRHARDARCPTFSSIEIGTTSME